MKAIASVPSSFSDRLSRFVDQAVAVLSPGWAFKRARYRMAANILKRSRWGSYRGAEKNRLRGDWVGIGGGSADSDLLPELDTLRERSRDLERNDPFATAASDTVTYNVVGHGIRPQSRPDMKGLGIDEATAREFATAAERAFKRWMPHADAQNRIDFFSIQQVIQRQILTNGEIFVLPLMIRDEPWRPYRLALELIEADRVQTPSGMWVNVNLRNGIELGSRGQPVAYWVRKRHPGDVSLNLGAGVTSAPENFIRYPARSPSGRRNIYHLYWLRRPGQSRGQPFFAPVLTLFKDLADYMEAEVVAARVSACFTAFVTKKDPVAAAANAATSTLSKGGRTQRHEELEPGMIEYLFEGEDVTFGQPTRPGTTFEPFVLLVLRAIGAALGLPLELILKDFSKTNYSSARASLLEARRYFKCYQHWLIAHFLQPVWESVLEEAWLNEELPPVNLLGPEADMWLRSRWIAPGWGWVDPQKEIGASTEAIAANLSTLADENAAQGRDWEEVVEQRRREIDAIRGMQPEPQTPAAPDPEAGMDDIVDRVVERVTEGG